MADTIYLQILLMEWKFIDKKMKKKKNYVLSSIQISPKNFEWFKRLPEEAWLLAAAKREATCRAGTSQH